MDQQNSTPTQLPPHPSDSLERTQAVRDVAPAPPASGAKDRPPQQYTAGCKWTSADWSCSYDVVFMSFWTIYEQSSAIWRNDWIQHAPNWNPPLAEQFDRLSLLADSPINATDFTAQFSSCRDHFRDRLSDHNPALFVRNGCVEASASRILEVIFGRESGPYLVQHLACPHCGREDQATRGMLLVTRNKVLVPGVTALLQTLWASFIQECQSTTSHQKATCSNCQTQNEIRGVEMPEVPWIWFEWGEAVLVGPSLTLKFSSPSQQLTYSLRSIIYTGQNHFTIRFRGKSGQWWKHDGQIASGAPQPDNIQSEALLLMNGARPACIYIYRRDDQ